MGVAVVETHLSACFWKASRPSLIRCEPLTRPDLSEHPPQREGVKQGQAITRGVWPLACIFPVVARLILLLNYSTSLFPDLIPDLDLSFLTLSSSSEE